METLVVILVILMVCGVISFATAAAVVLKLILASIAFTVILMVWGMITHKE